MCFIRATPLDLPPRQIPEERTGNKQHVDDRCEVVVIDLDLVDVRFASLDESHWASSRNVGTDGERLRHKRANELGMRGPGTES